MNHSQKVTEQLRFVQFKGDILTLRLGCNMPADEGLFRTHYGPQGSFKFWEIYTCRIVSLQEFPHTLALMLATNWNDIKTGEMALQKALIQAFQSDASFFRGKVEHLAGVNYFSEIKDPMAVTVITLAAALWLQSSPWWSHLVPPSLSAFLRGERPAAVGADNVSSTKPKRGPKGSLTQRTAERILLDLRNGVITRNTLNDEGQEALKSRYEVGSRSTVKKAWEIALAQFSEVLISTISDN